MNPAARRIAPSRRDGLVALLVGLVLATFTSTARGQDRRAVIPPGQEATVLAMLGGGDELPGQCHLDAASIEGAEITARYRCPGAQPALRLRHPDRAAPGDVRTDRFALAATPPFPAPLLDAVVARVRQREAAFHWLEIVPDRPKPSTVARARRANPPSPFPTAALFAVAIACGSYLAAHRLRHDRAARIDAAFTLALFVLALGLRLSLPWGPGDFAEPQRLSALWGEGPFDPGFATVPALARMIVVAHGSLSVALRWLGPTLGALNVAAVYLLARTVVGRPAAAAAALALLALPAHAHYSATPGIAVAGPAFWTLAWAVAAAPEPPRPVRLALIAALAGLAAQSRPEMRALALTLVPLAFGPGWTPRDRTMFAALAVAALVPAGIDVLHGSHDGGVARGSVGGWISFLGGGLLDVRRGAPWVLAAGAAGLVSGREHRTLRIALALGCALLLAQYLLFARETNPVWSNWRYLSAVVPAACVGAGIFVERLGERRRVATGVWVGLSVLTLALSAPRLRRPSDLAAELEFVRERTRTALGSRRELLILVGPDDARRAAVSYPANVLMGVALGVGSFDFRRNCDAETASGPTGLRVWSAEQAAHGCAHPPDTLGDAAVFLGAYAPPEIEAALRARWELLPLAVETRTVASTAPVYAISCRPLPRADGLCELRLGWYALRRR